jgi:SAM-dependent methyltransferase
MDRGETLGEAYVLPRDSAELDRLDVQHYAFKTACGGRNYLANVSRPARILDAGSGTGVWAHEVAGEWPGALVFGVDVVPGKPGAPGNYHFVRSNVLEGLPFRDGTFDFVHQRLMISAIPVSFWQDEISELVRITRPGGWIELAEVMPGPEPEGPATKRLWDLLRRLGRSVGHDTVGLIAGGLERHLEKAGVQHIHSRTIQIPVGDWGGQVGSWMTSDVRSLFFRLAPAFARYGLEPGECRELVGTMLQEFERLQSRITNRIAFGRRPLPRRSDAIVPELPRPDP